MIPKFLQLLYGIAEQQLLRTMDCHLVIWEDTTDWVGDFMDGWQIVSSPIVYFIHNNKTFHTILFSCCGKSGLRVLGNCILANYDGPGASFGAVLYWNWNFSIGIRNPLMVMFNYNDTELNHCKMNEVEQQLTLSTRISCPANTRHAMKQKVAFLNLRSFTCGIGWKLEEIGRGYFYVIRWNRSLVNKMLPLIL